MVITFHRINFQFDLYAPVGSSQKDLICGALTQNFLNAASQGMAIGLESEIIPNDSLGAEKLLFTAEVSGVCPNEVDEKAKSAYYSHVETLASDLWVGALSPQVCHVEQRQSVDHSQYIQFTLTRFDQRRFRILQEDFANRFQLPNKEQFLHFGDFRYRGFDMRLIYGEHRPDRFQLQIDLGAVPKSWTADFVVSVFRCLLSANHLGFCSSGLVWGINPQNDHLVLTSDYSVWLNEHGEQSVSVATLLKHIQTLCDQCDDFWETLVKSSNRLGDAVLAEMKSGMRFPKPEEMSP